MSKREVENSFDSGAAIRGAAYLPLSQHSGEVDARPARRVEGPNFRISRSRSSKLSDSTNNFRPAFRPSADAHAGTPVPEGLEIVRLPEASATSPPP
jgi:hypothetical protein